MARIFSFLVTVVDSRQQNKVVHSLTDIVLIVFFAQLADCNQWKEIHAFAVRYEQTLKKILSLEYGIPSTDTIRRVMSLLKPSVLEEVQSLWNTIVMESQIVDSKMTNSTGRTLLQQIAIDGKTMRGNTANGERPLHIVTAYSVENGLSFGQKAVDQKSNEITAIPQLLGMLNLKGHTVTIDAMGTQREIAAQITWQKGTYVLAVKGNQKLLHQEIALYLDDPQFERTLKKQKNCYSKTIESARAQIETREYYQTDEIEWMQEKDQWSGLKTIGKVVTTIEKGRERTQETRYYISSLPLGIERFQQAVRGHWQIESLHWHLDVTFGEDANHTLNQNAAQNLNILRKMSIPFLKNMILKQSQKWSSLKLRRFIIALDFPYYFGMFYEMYFAH